jgi:NAD(P)-dependent dehydrogenase (short-subunit alcohol dehydrogenase family)
VSAAAVATTPGRLAGKVALVTGASSGIGAATARAFAAQGAQVALLSRPSDRLDALAGELDGAIGIAADVSQPAQVAAAVERTERELGPVDVVVNSAGIAWPIPLGELEPERWREVIDVNLSGSFYVAREAGLRMVASGRGGSIVNLGSELSVLGMGMFVAYCTSKAGLIGLTKALAAELAPLVRVNAVCPGPVVTPMMTGAHDAQEDPAAAYAHTRGRVPLGRFGEPEEIAEGILYLAADASLATGAILHLDGGTTV